VTTEGGLKPEDEWMDDGFFLEVDGPRSRQYLVERLGTGGSECSGSTATVFVSYKFI
jgi:hypothetical protein